LSSGSSIHVLKSSPPSIISLEPEIFNKPLLINSEDEKQALVRVGEKDDISLFSTTEQDETDSFPISISSNLNKVNKPSSVFNEHTEKESTKKPYFNSDKTEAAISSDIITRTPAYVDTSKPQLMTDDIVEQKENADLKIEDTNGNSGGKGDNGNGRSRPVDIMAPSNVQMGMGSVENKDNIGRETIRPTPIIDNKHNKEDQSEEIIDGANESIDAVTAPDHGKGKLANLHPKAKSDKNNMLPSENYLTDNIVMDKLEELSEIKLPALETTTKMEIIVNTLSDPLINSDINRDDLQFNDIEKEIKKKVHYKSDLTTTDMRTTPASFSREDVIEYTEKPKINNTATIIEEKIEAEINQGINQLKSELKMLLVFNDNIQQTSHQIVKEATKEKVETFFKSVSTSLNMLNLKKNTKTPIEKAESEGPPSEEDMKKKEEDIKMATSILSITEDISAGLAATVEVGGTMEIQLPDISMAVMKKRLEPEGHQDTSSVWQSEELSVQLPDQSAIAGADNSITLAFTSYNTLGDMMTKTNEVSSPVLSVNVIGVETLGKSIPLTKPLEFVLRHENMTGFSHRKCVYWDFQEDSWSQEGCYPVREKSSVDRTSCQCYHLTNFAVLVDVHGLAASQEYKGTLNILTYIGCSISLCSLVICITVFATFRSAQNDRSSINTNLCACLLMAELVFLIGIGQTEFPSLCSVIAVSLHYLFLASFFWMLIAGFQIYVLLVEVFEPDNSRYAQYYMLGYIAPLLMVLFSLLVDTLFNNVSVYGSSEFCWIKGNIHLVLTFLAPVFCIVCVNIYFLSVAVWKIHIHSRDALIQHKSKTASLKLYVKGLFGLLFLLGATWSVGILSVTYPSVVVTYIFTILNSFQGFFIFIFNCIMNKKIRNEGRNMIEGALSYMTHSRKRTLLSRHESTVSNSSTTSNSADTNSTMVKEYFLPEIPYVYGALHKEKPKSNLSITYYY